LEHESKERERALRIGRKLTVLAACAGASLIPVALIAHAQSAPPSPPGAAQLARPSSIAAARPNIVLIVADDHGTDAIGAYGNRVIRTPNLDRLAAEGVRFTSAFATTASCSPSRSVLLTGLQGHTNGMYGLAQAPFNFQTAARIKSLPAILSANGYRTAIVGKNHVAPASVYKFDQVLEPAAKQPYTVGRNAVEMAELSDGVIASKDPRPFFLYFATDDPHRLGPHDVTRPNSFGNRPQGHPGVTEVTYDPAKVKVPGFLPDIPETRGEIAQYYQAVSRLDQGVGKLITELKAAGKYDNTIIIYLSDNGMAFPGAKTTLYDPGVRLPLIVKAPDNPGADRVSDALVSWTDITPTILDYAGVTQPSVKFQGASIRPVIEGAPEVQGRTAVFGSHSFHELQMYYPMRMIRTHRFKLIQNLAWPLAFPAASDLFHSSTWQATLKKKVLYGRRTVDAYLHRPEYELYDIETDPDEARNLAGDSAYATQLKQLQGRLHAFMKDTGDPWLSKLDYE
jgi:N-sulfoglucosamine sulfohydrolase